jgi:hypothetical protein
MSLRLEHGLYANIDFGAAQPQRRNRSSRIHAGLLETRFTLL